MANEIVPFGKYKGKPVETLRADRDYADWLTAQPWFRERFTGLFQIIVNNFGEPSETPEHNRLQARFLDDGFCRALLVALKWQPAAAPQQFIREHMRDEYGLITRLKKEVDRKSAAIDDLRQGIVDLQKELENPAYRADWSIKMLEGRKADLPKKELELQSLVARLAKAKRYAEQPAAVLPIVVERAFEVAGWDAVLECNARDAASEADAQISLSIEIKPALADEFPAVLRQIRARVPRNSYPMRCNPVLVIERFDAAGASFEQVRQIFGFPIVTIAEIEAERSDA